MTSNTNDNSTAEPTMTDTGHRTTKLPPNPNAEIISSSSVAALPKSEGASTESEPKVAAAASSEVVCVGRNNRAMTWGYSLNKGRRREMEDAITIVPSFMKLPCTAIGGCRAPDCKYAAEESSVHYFGLFDGHGGAQFTGNVASYGPLMQSASVARRSFDHVPQDFTPQQLLDSLRRPRQNDESASWERWGLSSRCDERDLGRYDRGSIGVSVEVSRYCSKRLHELLAEEWLRGSGENQWNDRWKEALTRAYNRADDAFMDKTLAPDTVGSTAVVVILSACQIIVANCGDSRAVLCRGSQAIPLTVDHKPDRSDELSRVTEAGGRILYVGCPTVEGILAMTRAIGDQDLKPWVISEPEVTFLTRTESDECFILASDGLWDVMSNEEVMGVAQRMLRELRKQFATAANGSVSPAQYVAEGVLEDALRTSSDNVSVIVVDLKRLRRRMQQKAAADI